MKDKFNHPVLSELYRTLDDIATLEAMLAEAKKKVYQDIVDLPAKIGDNEDLTDEVVHYLYWFEERVPVTALKQAFDRWPASQTRKANLHKAIRNAQIEFTCQQCKQPFLKEFNSRSDLANIGRYTITCKPCQEKNNLHTKEQYRQWEIQRQQRLDFLHTMPYYDYLQTPEWQDTRKRAMKRAGFRCQVCNAYGVRLNVHHRTYERRGYEENRDLIVLCENCHGIFHINGKLAGE